MIILDSSISLHLIATDKLYNVIFQKKFDLFIQMSSAAAEKGKQIVKNGFSGCKNSFYVKIFRLL